MASPHQVLVALPIVCLDYFVLFSVSASSLLIVG